MTRQEALEKLLTAHSGYYTINRENPSAPFAAEAEFRLHDEQFFLIRSAKISEVDSREYVFFALTDTLDPETFRKLEETAWKTGLSRVELTAFHRNSDVSLYILAKRIPAEVRRMVKKSRRYKSYRFGLQGWSASRLLAWDLSDNTVVHNARGSNLRQVTDSIMRQQQT